MVRGKGLFMTQSRDSMSVGCEHDQGSYLPTEVGIMLSPPLLIPPTHVAQCEGCKRVMSGQTTQSVQCLSLQQTLTFHLLIEVQQPNDMEAQNQESKVRV